MSKIAQPNKTLQKHGWTLTFSDEFDSLDGLEAPQNPSWWWSTRYPWGPTLNNELEYYTSYSKHPNPKCDPGGANHVLNSGPNVGTLQLIARQEPGSYEVWRWDAGGTFYTTCDPYSYTSGMIFSKQTFLYGYFEISAKIPNEGKSSGR